MPHGPGERAAIDIRRAKAVEMRIKGATWQQIADECGYADRGAACTDIRRFREETRAEAEEKLAELRALEVDRLDLLIAKAFEVLERKHLTISGGKVIRMIADGEVAEDGEPGEALVDDGPTLAAIDRITKLSESRRKLLGLDSPVQIGGEIEVKYTVNGVSSDDLT